MKVLVIATTSIGFDGITSVIMNNYLNMEKSDVEFSFIFPNTPPTHITEILMKDNVEMFIVPGRSSNTLSYMHAVHKIMRQKHYDIVHVHGNSNTLAIELFLGKINNIQVRMPHSHNTFTKFKNLNKILNIPFNLLYTHGLACGNEAGKWLYKEKNFVVIENGILTENYKFSANDRKQLRLELGFTKRDKILGHVGHFTYQKNQEYLIDLFIKSSNFKNKYKLILVGDGPLRESLENKVKQFNLEDIIKFVGKRTDVNRYYSLFDALVMPSRFEGLPLALVEAQSADLKCFVSENITKEVNITGSVEFFKIENDQTDLIEKINKYFTKEIIREDFKGNKIMEKSNFNIIQSANKLKNIYSNSIKNS
ncbi:glycosyltransferase [Fundicoccus sp. Sow4_F4]|uniref:glycosyltransferase n=1 Tax=Fundicoccus sp. Sow4_F4 TaxID=3438783 RepID=UPI003F915F04